jgi:hypothetical protein
MTTELRRFVYDQIWGKGQDRKRPKRQWTKEAMRSATPLRTQLAAEIKAANGQLAINPILMPYAVVRAKDSQFHSRYSTLRCATRTAAHLSFSAGKGMHCVLNEKTGVIVHAIDCARLAGNIMISRTEEGSRR